MAGILDYKEVESEIHEQLYNNLYLLSHFYPTSDNFNKIFKQDMFVKNNKAAFFEVIYYLLNALDPVLTTQKLTSWPPYDVKLENKFRSELLSYVNELNRLYENARIPQIMASHLISPGGFKVAHFIFMLSQLVMYEHLKKTHDEVLFCPVANEHTYNIQSANLDKEIYLIDQETQKNSEDFKNSYRQCSDKAHKIMSTLSNIDKEIEEAKYANKIAKEEFDKNYPSYPSLQKLKEKVDCLFKEWTNLKTIIDTINTVGSLLCQLNSSSTILDYNKEMLNIPNNILHIIKKGEELNLIELFQGLDFLLEYEALEVPSIDGLCNEENKDIVKDLCLKYLDIAYQAKEEMLQLKMSICNLSEHVKLIEVIDNKFQKNF